jgi:TraY domain
MTKPSEEGRRVALSLRLTPSIKELLDAAALEGGRSLSQEAEFRLEQSFQRDRLSRIEDILTEIACVLMPGVRPKKFLDQLRSEEVKRIKGGRRQYRANMGRARTQLAKVREELARITSEHPSRRAADKSSEPHAVADASKVKPTPKITKNC